MIVGEYWRGIIVVQKIITRDSLFIIQKGRDANKINTLTQTPFYKITFFEKWINIKSIESIGNKSTKTRFIIFVRDSTIILFVFIYSKVPLLLVYYYYIEAMNYLRKYFSFSEIDRFMIQNSLFNPKSRSQALLDELQSEQGHAKIQKYLCSSLSVQQQFKITALIAKLLTTSSNFYQIVQDCLQDEEESTEWLITKIILPFKKIQKKCSSTPQQFQDTKKKQFKKQDMVQNITYPINLIQQLILIGKQLPKFGRYYVNSNRQDHQVYMFFAQTYIIFLDHLYSALRYALQSYLRIVSKSLDITEYSQKVNILKWMLAQVIPSMNAAILQITRIKYFRFIQKGFQIKLFCIEEQSSMVQEFIKQHILNKTEDETKDRLPQSWIDFQMDKLEQTFTLMQQKLKKNHSQFSTDSQSFQTERQNL